MYVKEIIFSSSDCWLPFASLRRRPFFAPTPCCEPFAASPPRSVSPHRWCCHILRCHRCIRVMMKNPCNRGKKIDNTPLGCIRTHLEMVGMERKPSSCDACDDAFFHQTGDAEHDARTIERCGEYSIVQGLCCSFAALMGRLVACCISCGFAPFLSAYCIFGLFLSSTHRFALPGGDALQSV